MTNVVSAFLAVIAALLAAAWFAFARGYRRRTRLIGLGAAAALVLGFFATFRVTGVSGSMVPIIKPRWIASGPAMPATRTSAVELDLVTTTARDFPGFLGPRRDLRLDGPALARDWSSAPPELVWRQPIGAGWSAFAVVNGYAVTMEERDGHQAVTAYDAATGELMWIHAWEGTYSHSLGGPGPRSTPAIAHGYVVAQGPHGRVVCLDGADGSLVWSVDLLDGLGVSESQERSTIAYGRSGSPLVHDGLVIIPGGGARGGHLANLLAFDLRTGEIAWRGSGRQIAYSSPVIATVCGVEQLLIVNEDSVTGHDPATGRELWAHPWPGRSNADATSSQPVALSDCGVLVSKGYGVGAAALDLAPSGDGGYAVTERWRSSRVLRTKFTSAVVIGEYAYGLSEGILECVRLEDGSRMWKDGRYGHGQILAVGDLIIVLTEEGELVLTAAAPDAPDVLGRSPGIDGLTWNNIALAGDLLLIRNGQEAAAYRLPLVE